MPIFVDVQKISFLENNVDDLVDLSRMDEFDVTHNAFFSIEMRYCYDLLDVSNKKAVG
jgi:hypothetical protein